MRGKKASKHDMIPTTFCVSRRASLRGKKDPKHDYGGDRSHDLLRVKQTRYRCATRSGDSCPVFRMCCTEAITLIKETHQNAVPADVPRHLSSLGARNDPLRLHARYASAPTAQPPSNPDPWRPWGQAGQQAAPPSPSPGPVPSRPSLRRTRRTPSALRLGRTRHWHAPGSRPAARRH